ncbi:MAG TPA: hypothetical protein VEG63_08565 [Candidatus Acidoferrales bacterium]|nr:hypothetical protein [Candidatus Acidoferrales bacterium]
MPSQAAPSPDSITIPDGTPLTLKFPKKLSSATAQIGDTVELSTLQLRIDGLTVVPRGIPIVGRVVQVSRAHRPIRQGHLSVAVEKLVLPGGEVVALRSSPAASAKPDGLAAQSLRPNFTWGKLARLAPFDPVDASVDLLLAPFIKGEEMIIPAGATASVYFNGPVNLDRSAVMKQQPPGYVGPPQVFFTGLQRHDVVWCNARIVGDQPLLLQLELNPAHYLFTLKRSKKETVEIDLAQDHQYWIERKPEGLVRRDPERDKAEFDSLLRDPNIVDLDLVSRSYLDSCVPPDRSRR